MWFFGLLLAVTNDIAEEDIAARAVEDKENSLSQVLPDGIHDNNPVTDTVTLKNAEGRELTVFLAKKGGKVTGVRFAVTESRDGKLVDNYSSLTGPDNKGLVRAIEQQLALPTPR